MARAKHTDRAEARRRYRQSMADEAAAEATSEPGPAAAAKPRPAEANARTSRPTGRVSLLDSLRLSLQPADVRSDLAALPWLVTRTKAVWIPALLTVGAAAGFLVFGPSGNPLAVLAFQAFVVPPPMAAAFLAGLLTPRASWLAGGIAGIIGAVVYAVVAFTYPETAAGSGTINPTERVSAALFGLLMSPVMGFVIGAFAGFYRRFLRSANPNPDQRSKSRRSAARSSTARR